jgi:hypothetical protein
VVFGPGADEIRREALPAEIVPRPVENPGAERVEPLDPGKVDERPPRALSRAGQLLDLALYRTGVLTVQLPESRARSSLPDVSSSTRGSLTVVSCRKLG